LLEAMAERQVSIDGESHTLPNPFVVVATQNPSSHQGTFNLPEAQLDRFMMRLSLGYADAENETQILAGKDLRIQLQHQEPVMTADNLILLQQEVANIHCSETVCTYVQRLLQHTRDSGDFEEGLSTRAGQAILAAARANAFLKGDDFVMPVHVQRVFDAVTAHRLKLSSTSGGSHIATTQVIEQVAV
jgi:MoxR-like ATPase